MSKILTFDLLIVDDEEKWVKLFKEIIGDIYTYDIAYNYELAKDKIQQNIYTIICTNLDLGTGRVHDGRKLLNFLDKKRLAVPVILISGTIVGNPQKIIAKYPNIKQFLIKGQTEEFVEHLENAIKEIMTDIKQKKPDAFLAHNSDDKDVVRRIFEKLKQCGLKIWFDEEQIPPGQAFQDVIQQTIPNVKSAVICLGLNPLGGWQQEELRSLMTQSVETGIPVIPVLLPGVNEIPQNLSFFRERHWVKFENLDDAEALNKLIWGITVKHPKRDT